MRYQIYEAKSVKYDAQQRVGITPPLQHKSKREHPDFRSEVGLLSFALYHDFKSALLNSFSQPLSRIRSFIPSDFRKNQKTPESMFTHKAGRTHSSKPVKS